MTPRTVPILAFGVLLASTAGALAQVGRVAGVVTDEGGRAVKGAAITAANPDSSPSSLTATSNAKGQFALLGLRRGTWVFTVEAPGYETARAVLDVVTIRPNPPFNVRLLKGSAPPPPSPLAGIDARDLQRRIDTAESLAAAGDLDGAVAAYRDVVSRVPALTSVHLRIGTLLERRSDTAGALAAYRQLLVLEPGNAKAAAAVARLSRPD